MEKKILMIGVSTAQNTTNVLPALQMKIDYFIALETSAAHQRGWSNGMYAVLKQKGIKVLDPIILKPEEDSRIDLISTKLHNIIPKNVEVLWNLGGGQKAQQFGLWKTFMDRVKNGYDEIACYANPESKLLEIWEYDKNALSFYSNPIESTLFAKDIFDIYGYELNIPKGALFYTNKQYHPVLYGYSKLLDYKEFRKFFFKVPKTSPDNKENQIVISKQELLNLAGKIDDEKLKSYYHKELIKKQKLNQILDEQIVPALRKRIVNEFKSLFNKSQKTEIISIYERHLKELLQKITFKNIAELEISLDYFNKIFPDFRKTSFLFESILQEKVIELLVENPNYITEAYSNVTLYSKEGEVVAEYDILFVTQWGTLIAIDAKTFDVNVKDIDARILKLREGAGRYVDFVVVFPYYPEDIDSKWFPKEIRELPVKLKKHNLKFFAYNNQPGPFAVDIFNNGKAISLSPVSNILDFLNLIKK